MINLFNENSSKKNVIKKLIFKDLIHLTFLLMVIKKLNFC